jgi:multidrug transporter EmrE-like cation transporter
LNRYLLYILASALAAVGIVFLKKLDLNLFVRDGIYPGIIGALSNKFFWMGMVLYGGAFVLFLVIINNYKVSTSVPALLCVYVITLGVVGYTMGEELSARQLIAYVLLVAGISLL